MVSCHGSLGRQPRRRRRSCARPPGRIACSGGRTRARRSSATARAPRSRSPTTARSLPHSFCRRAGMKAQPYTLSPTTLNPTARLQAHSCWDSVFELALKLCGAAQVSEYVRERVDAELDAARRRVDAREMAALPRWGPYQRRIGLSTAAPWCLAGF